MKKYKKNKLGFTLIEAMVTLSILGILTTLGAKEINQSRAKAELNTKSNEIVSILETSQNQAMSSKNGKSSSVCFNQSENNYKLISGNNCQISGAEYQLGDQVFLKQIILDSNDKIEFKKLNGDPAYPGKIIIGHKQLPNQEIIININNKGTITIL